MTECKALEGRLRPWSMLAIGRANATVTQRGMMAHVRVGSNPKRRPAAAVEYIENMEETITAVNISAACLWTTCKHYLSGQ